MVLYRPDPDGDEVIGSATILNRAGIRLRMFVITMSDTESANAQNVTSTSTGPFNR